MLVLKLLLVCFGYHAPCGCVACVFSRCTQNRVNSHQVVQIAGSYLNTYPCILGRMIPVLKVMFSQWLPCLGPQFLQLGYKLYLSMGESLYEQMRLYMGKESPCFINKKMDSELAVTFQEEELSSQMVLAEHWVGEMATVKKSRWTIRICRKGTEGKQEHFHAIV